MTGLISWSAAAILDGPYEGNHGIDQKESDPALISKPTWVERIEAEEHDNMLHFYTGEIEAAAPRRSEDDTPYRGMTNKAIRVHEVAEKIEKKEDDRKDLIRYYLGEIDTPDIGLDLNDMDSWAWPSKMCNLEDKPVAEETQIERSSLLKMVVETAEHARMQSSISDALSQVPIERAQSQKCLSSEDLARKGSLRKFSSLRSYSDPFPHSGDEGVSVDVAKVKTSFGDSTSNCVSFYNWLQQEGSCRRGSISRAA